MKTTLKDITLKDITLANIPPLDTSAMDRFTDEIAHRLAAGRDALIRRCISKRIGDNWTDTEIIPRLRWEAYRDSPEQTLLLDDQPILVIWPATCEAANEDGRNMMNWKFNYREIL
jgi:hypothetical protein